MDSKNQNSIGLRTLIAKAQAGDEGAFASLVQRFQQMAVHICYGYLGDWQLAEDAAQDAWIAAFRELPSLREPAAFVAWFRTVLFKQCDRLTRRKAARIRPLATAETLPDAALPHDERVATDEQCALIEVALALLPERERAVVERFYVAEQDQQTIGASLGMPVQTVKNRLFAARRQLRATLSALDAPAVHTAKSAATVA